MIISSIVLFFESILNNIAIPLSSEIKILATIYSSNPSQVKFFLIAVFFGRSIGLIIDYYLGILGSVAIELIKKNSHKSNALNAKTYDRHIRILSGVILVLFSFLNSFYVSSVITLCGLLKLNRKFCILWLLVSSLVYVIEIYYSFLRWSF